MVKWVEVKTYCHGIKPSSFGARYQGFIHRGHSFAEIQLCEVTQALKEAVAELAGATWALTGFSGRQTLWQRESHHSFKGKLSINNII